MERNEIAASPFELSRMTIWKLRRQPLPLPPRGSSRRLWSAIMMVGALVLVEVTAGITEASITRSPSSPCTRSWSSTTDIGSGPILQVQVAWNTVEPVCRR